MNVKHKNDNKMNSIPLDTPVKPEHDTLSHCHSGPRAGIQGNKNLMPKAFRINQNADAYGNNNLLDTGVQHQYDKEEKMSSSDTPSLSPSGPLFLSPSGLTGGVIPTLSPSGPIGGSIGQECRLAQSGRSMVEMLGTLAIIGVLSIGGIAGYSYGMDKYKANQTVNDIMLRAVDIMTQMSQGREPDLKSEWGTKGTVYDMEPIYDDATKTYGIVVDGVPSRVCQMIGDALKTQATVFVGNAERNDTTDNDPCDESDKNTMEFYFEPITSEFGECKTDADCGENKYCDMGLCFNGHRPEVTANVMGGTCETDADCNTGWTGNNCAYCDPTYGCVENRDNHNKTCTLTDGNVAGKCGGGECNPSGCTYDNNKCEGKTYCASPNSSCTEAFPSGETGMCVSANTTFSKVPGTEYYVSNGPISWWDADAACKALNKSLLSLDDLLTDWDRDKWGSGSGKTYYFTLSTLAEQLYRQVWNNNGYPYIWTENLTDGVNSCYAYDVDLNDGYVGGNGYGDDDHIYYAVCR